MKKIKFVLPVLAVIMAVVAVFAFKPKPVATVIADKPLTDYHYFEYTGPDAQESSYENPLNWIYRSTTDPGDCPGDDIPCIVRVDLDVYTSLDLSSDQEDNWVDFLETLQGPGSDPTTGAITYMSNGSNSIHLKFE